MLGILDRGQVEELLWNEVVGRIGCVMGGRSYVVPVTYAYDGECVYAHSTEGLKVRSMREHPEVCFEVEHIDDLSDWQSVIAWGHFEELTGEEAVMGMGVLLRRLAPLMVSETSVPTHGFSEHRDLQSPAVVYRIRLGERTGRFERP